jgi:hypothetical protein
MAGLVPAIHALLAAPPEDVDARHKRGHDGVIDALIGSPSHDKNNRKNNRKLTKSEMAI